MTDISEVAANRPFRPKNSAGLLFITYYGLGMSAHRPLDSHTPEQLRTRAREYREMAQTATSAETGAGLVRLAEQFEAMADTREQGKCTATG